MSKIPTYEQLKESHDQFESEARATINKWNGLRNLQAVEVIVLAAIDLSGVVLAAERDREGGQLLLDPRLAQLLIETLDNLIDSIELMDSLSEMEGMGSHEALAFAMNRMADKLRTVDPAPAPADPAA